MFRHFILAGLVIVAAAAGIYVVFLHDLSRARALLVGRSKSIDTSFGAVEYATLGKGKPALIVHGAAGGFDQALEMTGALAERGYELIAPSRFGYLGSTVNSNLATTALQVDAYAALLDRLGIGKASVVSISAGAWSALEFAVRHPDRCQALALVVPADQLPPQTENHGGVIVRAMLASDFVAWLSIKLWSILPGAIASVMLGTDSRVVGSATPGEKARIKRALDHLLPVSQRTRGMQFDIKTAASPKPLPLDEIKCPVLAVSAEDDLFGTAARARQIAAAVAHGNAVIYPTGGHALVGHYDDALSEVTLFLSRTASAHSELDR